MRCRRCHTKLDPAKKMCPNCGTLVRKKRGNVKIASTAGVGPMWLTEIVDRINRIPPKILIGAVATIFLVLILILFGNCSACSGCSSCSSCSSCNSCGSCSSCGESASGNAKPADENAAVKKLNTGGIICADNENLYYVKGSSIMKSGKNGETVLIQSDAGAIKLIDTDGINLYYMQNGSLWRMPFGNTTVQGSAPVARCVVRAINETDVISGYVSVSGYGVVDSEKLCCWGTATDGTIKICTVDASGASLTEVIRGDFSHLEYYNGRVYYYNNPTGKLACVDLGSGKTKEFAINYDSAGYALGGGYIYFCETATDGAKTLCRMKISSEKKTEWFTDDPYIVGITANDLSVCFWTKLPEGSDLYRYGHDGKGERFVSSARPISLDCMAGEYLLLHDDTQLKLYRGSGEYIQTIG